mgnify:CR=1 FL=1
MILLLAVAAGLPAGWLWARLRKKTYRAPNLKYTWLVFGAVLPQLFVFHLPATAVRLPSSLASLILVGSQLCLLVFAWTNKSQPGFWALGLGLLLNLIAIAVNGGWMPISTHTIQELHPQIPLQDWNVGGRAGYSKNILLPPSRIQLGWLGDRFLTPAWFPWPRAFSLGDILLSLGAFRLLLAPEEQSPITKTLSECLSTAPANVE